MVFTAVKYSICVVALLAIVQNNKVQCDLLKNGQQLADIRIVIIGQTGVGKSSLANVLLGRDKHYEGEGFENGCFKVAWHKPGDEGSVITTDTCHDTGYYLNDASKPNVTVIDTPGFGDQMEAEVQTINRLVDVLKDDIKYVNVFVICFQQNDNRMKDSMLRMLNLFQRMFGKDFWENAILEATHWNHNKRSVAKREKNGLRGPDGKLLPKTEENWKNQFNVILKNKLGVNKKLDAVFIDSHYNDKYPEETSKFTENAEKLLTFARATKRFNTRDIDAVLPELYEKKQELEKIKIQNQGIKDELNNKADEIKFLDTELKASKQKLKSSESVSYSKSSFAGIAVGMLLLGIILGFIVKGYVQKTNKVDSDTTEYRSNSNSFVCDAEANKGTEELPDSNETEDLKQDTNNI